MTHAFDPTILREYDIRGIVDRTLSDQDAWALGRSFATLLAQRGGEAVAVGYDGRASSPRLEGALVAGLLESGIKVSRIGLSATPMLYYAATELGLDGGIQITGSHNPPDYNGFKMTMFGSPVYGDLIKKIGKVAEDGDWSVGQGSDQVVDILDSYVNRLLKGIKIPELTVAWDSGNGAAGPALEKLTAQLPGRHILLNENVDGSFPAHHPDPTIAENLQQLIACVKEEGCDLGIAFDGDGDRIGAVDSLGRIVWGDQLLMIYAQEVLTHIPGATVIADVKASQALFNRIAQLGGQPLMWKTGHSLIKAKMKETGCPLAGEMSGHIFIAHDYYGFDDALYAAVRLLHALNAIGKSLTEMKSAMPQLVNTPEIRIEVDELRKFAIVQEVLDRLHAQGADIDTTDGARVNCSDGWWLLRASNTQNVLVARAEANNEQSLRNLLDQIRDQLGQSGITFPADCMA